MLILEKKFNSILNQRFLFEDNPKIAVAVSGGPDSIALFFLLQKWILKKKGKLIALIVDHRIRKGSFEESISIFCALLSRPLQKWRGKGYQKGYI